MSLISAKCKNVLLVLAALLVVMAVGAGWLLHSAAEGVPVLNYHQINDKDENALTVHVDQFEAQMAYLAENGYHAITPAQMLDAWENGTELPDKPVIITFDDGYVDNYKNAYPILKKYGLKGTIFAVTDYLGTYPNYFTWAQAKEMQDSGVMEIESHTLSHMELTTAGSEEELRHQLVDSKKALDWHLGKDVRFIAYPCGSYNEEIERIAHEAGYRAAFTVHYGLADPEENREIMDRVPIFGSNNHTLLRFKLRLNYAPIFGPLDDLQRSLNKNGHNFLASLLIVP